MQKRNEVIFAGLGGMGVLLSGELLTRSAAKQYKHALWLPNYTTSQRGAPCNCIVIISDEEIYSPLIDQTDVVVVMSPSELSTFGKRAKPGGIIIAESFGLAEKSDRDDITFVEMPAIQTAMKRGSMMGSNLVAFGFLLAISSMVSLENARESIEEKFSGKKAALTNNMELFEEGLDLGRNALA